MPEQRLLSTEADISPLNAVELTTSSAALTGAGPDLMWRNASSGSNTLWSLEGGVSGEPRTLDRTADASWKVVGIADFNRDRQDDLLWHNTQTGEVQLWTLDGSTTTQKTLATIADLRWQIAGVGDLDRDGSVDILWRHYGSGDVVYWLMDGTNYRSYSALPNRPDTDWKIDFLGDFNGDGNLDVQWRNLRTGDVDLWLLDRTSLNRSVALGSVPLEWRVSAVGDFDNDQQSDLVWQHQPSGTIAFWLINNGTLGSWFTAPRQMDATWQIMGATDLNADGSLDLLWNNTVTGENTRWFLDRGRYLRQDTLDAAPDAGWKPVGLLSRSSSSIAPSTLTTTAPTTRTTTPAALTAGDTLGNAPTATPSFSASGQVSAQTPNQFYKFSIVQSGVFTANLTGLSGDADVRLIRDSNNNGTIDSGEVLAYQWERGPNNESIRRFLDQPGTYYVQVMNYRGASANYSVSTGFTATAQDDQRFGLNVSRGAGLSGLSDAAWSTIERAAKFWQDTITNRSAITEFNDLNVTISGESFVYSNGAADSSTLVLAGPTFGLDANNRVVIRRGSATINARKFSEFNGNLDYLYNVMVHELAHVLGVGTNWEPVEFMYTDGSRATFGNNLINRSNATYIGTYAQVAYGDLLGRGPTPVPIEPGVFAHWDEARLDTELMTPYAETPGVLMPLTAVTLGSMRDLGWNVNFGAVQPYTLPA